MVRALLVQHLGLALGGKEIWEGGFVMHKVPLLYELMWLRLGRALGEGIWGRDEAYDPCFHL